MSVRKRFGLTEAVICLRATKRQNCLARRQMAYRGLVGDLCKSFYVLAVTCVTQAILTG